MSASAAVAPQPNEGRLWAERAAEYRSEAERMSREFRDNLFGREAAPVTPAPYVARMLILRPTRCH